MTDKKLLELAAKAAGIEIQWKKCAANMDDYSLSVEIGPYIGNVGWNPLTDDGDALRLAVKLKIPVCFPEGTNSVRADSVGENCFHYEDLGGDDNSSTRRAIVRAAAEIGEKMP